MDFKIVHKRHAKKAFSNLLELRPFLFTQNVNREHNSPTKTHEVPEISKL